MVHYGMAHSPARQRLLDAVVAKALSTGIGELSLRELAAAIGTSHRMLVYHFGSREGLLAAVTYEVESLARSALLRELTTDGDPRDHWRRLSAPEMWPQERLFFELYSRALFDREGTTGFLDGIVDDWVEPVAEVLVERGLDPVDARTEARLGVAVTRGLLLDLVATGDHEAVDRAFERYLDLLGIA